MIEPNPLKLNTGKQSKKIILGWLTAIYTEVQSLHISSKVPPAFLQKHPT